ncbi:MAG: glycosyltransferase [Phycisphaerae bacterium]|nr:glycosyltransferase [Phycisphaerae bacterium]
MTWQVQILGTPHWAAVLAGLLRACGIQCSYTNELEGLRGLAARAHFVRWGLGRALAHANVVHYVYVSRSMTLPRVVHWRGRPQIMHWIGTDVLSVQQLPNWRRRIWLRTARRVVALHLADSPELAEEVQELGLPRPRVVRLLPTTLRACPSPMPEPFSALSYWSDLRQGLYRGEWVLRLAREFPQIPFYIVGRCTPPPDTPPNVTFVGWVEDMAPWYERASVLIRLPIHDSVSVMVLEMLARGRHAIYSRDFPHCHFADTYEAARDALDQLVKSNAPNPEAPAYVSREYNPADSVAALREAYDELTKQVSGRS